MPVDSSTDCVSAAAAAAAANSPANTITGVRRLSASATSLRAPVLRAMPTWCRDRTYAPSSSHTSRATTQPCHKRRS